MAVKKDELNKLLIQVRRIEENRELGTEKKIRKTYKQLTKELNQFLGEEYATLAQDGRLTYEILAEKQGYARFLEEVTNKVDGIAPEIQDEITKLVNETYEASYLGMIEAAAKTSPQAVRTALKGLSYVLPEQVKRAVENPIHGLTLNDTLEKNRKEVIYNIKREIGIGITNGDRIDIMAKRITKTLDGDYQKAIRVARTETHRVREGGMHDGAVEFDEALKNGLSGMRMVKIWRTMKDERVRPNRGIGKKPAKGGANHQIMDGVAVLTDEEFELSTGATTLTPGQSGNASEDINCRCYLRYKLMDDDEFFELTGRHFP